MQRTANIRSKAIVQPPLSTHKITLLCYNSWDLCLTTKAVISCNLLCLSHMGYIKNDKVIQSSLTCIPQQTHGKAEFLRMRLMTCLHMPWILSQCSWIPWYRSKRAGTSLILSTETSGIHPVLLLNLFSIKAECSQVVNQSHQWLKVFIYEITLVSRSWALLWMISMPPESRCQNIKHLSFSQSSPSHSLPLQMCVKYIPLPFCQYRFHHHQKPIEISSVYQPLTTSFPKGKYNLFLTIWVFKRFFCVQSQVITNKIDFILLFHLLWLHAGLDLRCSVSLYF